MNYILINIKTRISRIQPPSYFKSWKLKDYQNAANLFICSMTTINLWIYNKTNQYLSLSIPLIFTHFAIDIFFCKKEFKVHHFFGLLVIAFKYYHNMSKENATILIISLYKTELSTFFYVFRYYLNKLIKSNVNTPSVSTGKTLIKWINILNSAVFFLTFFKFRMFDFYNDVIVNPAVYKQLQPYTQNSTIQTLFIYTGLYGLFLLNMYWFAIMCKVIYKPIHQLLSDRICIPLCHTIVSYTYIVNVPISVLLYSSSPKPSYLFDMIGIMALTYGSFFYHQKVIEYYNSHKQIEYTSYELMYPFVLDQVAIHTRMFLCTVTNVYYLDQTTMQLLLLFSFAKHASSIYHLIKYLYDLKYQGQQILYNNKNEHTQRFLSIVNGVLFIPIIIDGLIIFFNTSHLVYKLNAVFITAMCIIILKIAPFYELNHVLFHMCAIAQNVYLILCNMSVAK